LHWFFCFVFVDKSKAVESSFASASSRYLLHYWLRKCGLKNVRHSLLVLLRSTPLVHHHSMFISYYLFHVHYHEKSSNHLTPVIVIIFCSSYHPRIMHKIMYIRASFLFCVESSDPFCIIYFMPAWCEGWQVCVDTTLINEFTYLHTYVCM